MIHRGEKGIVAGVDEVCEVFDGGEIEMNTSGLVLAVRLAGAGQGLKI